MSKAQREGALPNTLHGDADPSTCLTWGFVDSLAQLSGVSRHTHSIGAPENPTLGSLLLFVFHYFCSLRRIGLDLTVFALKAI